MSGIRLSYTPAPGEKPVLTHYAGSTRVGCAATPEAALALLRTPWAQQTGAPEVVDAVDTIDRFCREPSGMDQWRECFAPAFKGEHE